MSALDGAGERGGLSESKPAFQPPILTGLLSSEPAPPPMPARTAPPTSGTEESGPGRGNNPDYSGLSSERKDWERDVLASFFQHAQANLEDAAFEWFPDYVLALSLAIKATR